MSKATLLLIITCSIIAVGVGTVLYISNFRTQSSDNNQQQMIVDPKAISECKRRFKNHITPIYNEAIANVTESGRLSPDHQFALLQNREEAISDLAKIMYDEGERSAFRIFAATLMARMDDHDAISFLLENLHSNNFRTRIAAAWSVYDIVDKIDTADKEVQNLLLSLLEDSDKEIAEAGAFICEKANIPGFEKKATQQLAEEESKIGAQLADAISPTVTSIETLDLLLAQIIDFESESFHNVGSAALDPLINHKDPKISARAKKAMFDYVMRFEEMRYHEAAVQWLAKCADKDGIDVLNDILTNADSVTSKMYALEGLCTLQPDQAVEMILKFQDDNKPYGDIELLASCVTEKDYHRVAPVYEKGLAKPDAILHPVDVKLLLNLGDKGKQLVKANMDKLSGPAKMLAKWRLDGLNLEMALDELHSAGVIKSEPVNILNALDRPLARSQFANRFGQEYTTSNPIALYRAFEVDGIDTHFQLENVFEYFGHDRLVVFFSKQSAGQFTPSYSIEFQQPQTDGTENPQTILQFILDDKLFQSQIDNRGKRYNVDSTVNLINFALNKTGKSKRYIRLSGPEDLAVFIFADPEKFVPIARKYGIPIDSSYVSF